MTNFIGWTPPPGVAVVAPPVHPETVVSAIYSDGIVDGDRPARCHNWSAVGDGPRVVAFAVVEEYKPAPELREWWVDPGRCICTGFFHHGFIHVREVPDPSREVVAWAVVNHGGARDLCFDEASARATLTARTGGTVVRLTGVMTNG